LFETYRGWFNWNKLMRKGMHLVGLSQVYVSRCTVRRMQNQTRHSPALWNPKVWLSKQGCSLVDMGAVQYIPLISLTVFSRTNPLISYNPLITIFLIVRASFFPFNSNQNPAQYSSLHHAYHISGMLEGYGNSVAWIPGARYKDLFSPHRVPVIFLFAI